MSELDIRLFRALHEALGGGLLAPMAVLTIVGGGWGALSIVPFLAAARTRRFAIAFAATVGVNTLVVFALKAAIARPRPWNVMPDIHPLVFAGPTDFSFPSGHAAGAFCYATFVTVVLIKTKKGLLPVAVSALLLLLASGVALSRIALGVHFPGDIGAGAVIGATFGAVGAHVYLRRLRAAAAAAGLEPSNAATHSPSRASKSTG